MPELVYEVAGNIYALFILNEGREREYHIGRDPENDFCLSQADGSTSGHHATVRFRNGGFIYLDRDSRNKSFLQKSGESGEIFWQEIQGRETPLTPGDVLRLGEKTFLHFGDYLAHGSFFLAERLVEMFAAVEKEGGELPEVLSTFLYRLLGIVLNILQAREGFIEVAAALAGTEEDLRVGGLRDREVPHVRTGQRAILRTLSPEELTAVEWKAAVVAPICPPWVKAIRRGDNVRHLFSEEIGVEFSRVKPLESAMAMRHRAICVPLKAGGQNIGVLYVAREKEAGSAFLKDDAIRAEDIGVLAGAVLDRLLARRGRDPLDDLFGNPEVRATIRQWEGNAAWADLPVLISGEQGTGKEIAARAIHHHGRRRTGPLVAVNVALHEGDRLAPELFGTAAGKFTGVTDSAGLFEVASGGTLFLDEIGEMAPEAQGKLLRAVEQKEITRVGGTEARKIDVRVVAATNRDLRAEARAGRFRPDLLDRLAFLDLKLTPVRAFPEEERRELFVKVLGRMCFRLNIWGLDGIGEEAMAVLAPYRWLGNVREVEKEIGNAAIRWASEAPATRGREITARHLSPQILLYRPEEETPARSPESAGKGGGRLHGKHREARAGIGGSPVAAAAGESTDLDVHRAIEAVTRDHFERALELSGGKADEAAKLLGLNVKTFYRRLKEVGLGGRTIRRAGARK